PPPPRRPRAPAAAITPAAASNARFTTSTALGRLSARSASGATVRAPYSVARCSLASASAPSRPRVRRLSGMALAADQQAMLQLLLERGQSYADLGSVLG